MDFEEILTRIQRIYNSCTESEKYILRNILEEISETGESRTYRDIWLADYKEIPVDIDTFLDNDMYLGGVTRQGTAIYPFWRNAMREIFSAGNQYQEIMLTGATRTGKTSTAITCAAYMLYKLMCLRDPQAFFNKKDVSKFSVLFFNVTKDLAKGVAFREFNDTLKASPWFSNHGKVSRSEKDFYYIPEGGKIDIDYGSSAEHGLGKQVFVGFMDEVNFQRTGIKDVNKAKENMQATYNTVVARVKGTFRQEGEVFGKIFAVSSKKSDSDFMEAYIQSQLSAGAEEHMYVADKPQWEVLPPETFHKEKFYIAVGNRYNKGFVLNEEEPSPESIVELQTQGYKILTPPIDVKSQFLADFEIALRDIAGISVPGALSYITQESITQCINEDRKNPFYNDILSIGTKDNLFIEEFFHLNEVPKECMYSPMFIHLDLSLNTDRTGISGVCVTGRQDVKGVDGKIVSQPKFTHCFSVALEAPRDDKIPYDKITQFICWLRRSGFNISHISRDQFQSEYMAQLLQAQGFDVDKISLDRTPDGYMAGRSIIMEKRVDMIDCKLLQDEMIHLQRDSVTGKIDHLVGQCLPGDTQVALVDGRNVSIDDLLLEQEYKENWVYTVNEETFDIEPKRIKNIFQTQLTTELYQITLDNGEKFCCTGNHPIMMRDGTYKQASKINVEDYVMPLYHRYPEKGLTDYKLIYNPGDRHWHYEHRMFSEKDSPVGYVIHHCNFNCKDNRPKNLKVVTKSEHVKMHNNSTTNYEKISESMKEWHKTHKKTKEYAARNRRISNKLQYKWSKNSDHQRKLKEKLDRIKEIERIFGVCWAELTMYQRSAYSRKYHAYLEPGYYDELRAKLDPEVERARRQHVSERLKHMIWINDGQVSRYIRDTDPIPEGWQRGRIIPSETKKVMAATRLNRMWVTNGEDDKLILKSSDIPEGYHPGRSKGKRVYKNHVVVAVKKVKRICRVYDLTIEDNPNFALSCGVFVHNSKDVSDSFVGALWNAMLTNPGVRLPSNTISAAISDINRGASLDRDPMRGLFSNMYNVNRRK